MQCIYNSAKGSLVADVEGTLLGPMEGKEGSSGESLIRERSYDSTFMSSEILIQEMMELSSNPSIQREMSIEESSAIHRENSEIKGPVYRFLYLTNRIVMYVPPTPRGALFTATHTLLLKRDGKSVNKKESCTYELVLAFSELCQGVALTWSAEEMRRANSLLEPDPVNRDPNYLQDEEAQDMRTNPWLYGMSMCQILFPDPKLSFHIDIHGMKDIDECDLCISYASMARHQNWDADEKTAFELNILQLLDGFYEDFCGVAVNDIQLTNGVVMSLCDDWNSGRNTLTQVSTNKDLILDGKCFRQAIRLELSLRLRKKLVDDKLMRIKFLQLLFKIEFPVQRNTLKISFPAASRGSTDEQVTVALKRMHE